MTAPRQVLPGRTYLITRRCTQRQFLLKPSRLTNHLARYCLAVAATQTGVQLHAVCVMSNHWHGVVSDPFARLPEFLERFHRLLARAQNVALGRRENLWSSDKASVVHLVSDEDVLEKMAYTIANPTAAGLVYSPDEWPGVVTRRIGERCVVAMPETFFDPSGNLPESVTLVMQRPPIYPELGDRELALRLVGAIARRVHDARRALAELGQRFLGAKSVLRQAFAAAPASRAERRRLIPRLAAGNLVERVGALRSLKAFRRAYRAALSAWRLGIREVLFPPGTYALRIYARVACAPPCPT